MILHPQISTHRAQETCKIKGSSNALAFVMRLLIGQRQTFATVYPVIYCRKHFDVIKYFTFHIMWLGTFQFETKLQTYIRIGIAIFKIFICGGKWSDIHSEITFYSSPCASP